MNKKILPLIIAIFIILLSIFVLKSHKMTEQSENKEKTEIIEEQKQETYKSVLSGKTIVIDPGHGLNYISDYEPYAPGSSKTKPAYVSGTKGKYQTEEELNLSVGKLLYNELLDFGAKTYMTRHGHYSERSNIERASFANDFYADLCIRLHADGSDNKNESGISVLVPGENHYKDVDILDTSRRAGEILLENVINTTGARNRGISARTDLTGFNWSRVPVVLIEMGFMTNENEDYLLSQEDYQRKIATGIINGLEEYFSTEQ